MQTLSQGKKLAEVMFLQRMLNKRGASPQLGEDGDFGPKTHTATVAFQRANHVHPANGVVTASTWNAFGFIIEHQHNIILAAQPTDMTCWSAAATMMKGSNISVGPGGGALTPSGGLTPTIENVETFVADMGWRMVNSQSAPGVSVLVSALARGPVWVAFLGHHFAHAVVLSAIWSDRAEDGTGTVMRIHDPWPKFIGTIYGTTYLRSQIYLRSIHPPLPAMIQFMAQ